MKQFLKLYACLAFVLFPISAYSQTQSDINHRARADFEAADNELKTLYDTIAAKLDASAREKLTASQRAWSTYRQTEAALESDEVRGGTLSASLSFAAQTELTSERIQRLRKMLLALEAR